MQITPRRNRRDFHARAGSSPPPKSAGRRKSAAKISMAPERPARKRRTNIFTHFGDEKGRGQEHSHIPMARRFSFSGRAYTQAASAAQGESRSA